MTDSRWQLVLALALLCGCSGNVDSPDSGPDGAKDSPLMQPNEPPPTELPQPGPDAPDPAATTDQAAEASRGSSFHLTLVGQLKATVDDPFVSLAVQNQTVYLVQGNIETGKRFHAVDISERSQPRVVGTCDLEINAIAVAVSDRFACVLDDPHLKVLDVSDPTAPHVVGSCELGEHLWALTIEGARAYVTDLVSVRVVDLSNPTVPVEIGRCELEDAQGITISGANAFVACDIEGMSILDISDPTAPRPVSRFDLSAGASSILVAGQIAYIAGGEDAVTLWIVDISNLNDPRPLGKYGDWIAGSLAIAGDHLLLAGGDLEVVDVSNPSSPRRAGSYRDAGFITMQGTEVFLLGDSGFSILHAEQPGK